jgi:hypothetical protein
MLRNVYPFSEFATPTCGRGNREFGPPIVVIVLELHGMRADTIGLQSAPDATSARISGSESCVFIATRVIFLLP